MSQLTHQDLFERGVDLFALGQLEHARDSWEQTQGNSGSAYQLLCRAMLCCLAAEEARQKCEWVTVEDMLTKAAELLLKVPAKDVEIDAEALYESLISVWPELRAQTLGPIGRQLAVKTRVVTLKSELQSGEVQCPHCLEWSPVAAEMDEQAEDVMHQDCPVCCRPWEVVVIGDRENRHYVIRNPEG